MKKVLIIGCPGSGKSTFGRTLSSVTALPLYHLDMMFWNADKTTVSREILIGRIQNVMNNSEWIIDGNYSSTMEMRLKECDTVFFLDYPTSVCIEGVKCRKGVLRSDMPWVEENDDEEFIKYVKEFNIKNRPEVIGLLNKYSSKNIIIFHSREESQRFISSLKSKLL